MHQYFYLPMPDRVFFYCFPSVVDTYLLTDIFIKMGISADDNVVCALYFCVKEIHKI
jgi:hypothetical protein